MEDEAANPCSVVYDNVNRQVMLIDSDLSACKNIKLA